MNICPQCKTVYDDDYVFCLTDGNALINDDVEQETVINPRVRLSMPVGGAGAGTVPCPTCGLENRANSKFCKKCGAILAGASFVGGSVPSPAMPFSFLSCQGQSPGQGIAQFGDLTDRVDETVAFRLPVFVPPGASGQITGAGRSGVSQTQMLLIGMLIAAVIIGGAIIYGMSGETKKSTTVPNGAANSRPASSDSRVGKTGTFSTDSRLRQSPGSTEAILGIQYAGARVRILNAAEVQNDDGGTSTWFEVQVTAYGRSRDPKNNGLDKDPGTPDQGWVNSYPLVYVDNGTRKTRVTLINFD